ncbi:MAG: circularly permuted type 2 ATP-grasp protein, partial [Planctomycetia bacterium]|nr:circularly permuted type 2 ATP-grasp protein [Planctomycetia bacterium]
MAIIEGGTTAQKRSGSGLFEGYAVRPGIFDEMCAAGGAVRPHWQPFVQSVSKLGEQEFTRLWDQAGRLVHEHGIVFSAYGDPRDKPRPWRLDPLPLIIDADEWQGVSEALEQRARLLNLILADLYGP